MKLFEFQFLLEMAAKKSCSVCGHSMANFHFYRNGGWYCKTSSLSAPAPGADVAACKAALAAGKAPRVSNNASTPSATTPAAVATAAPAPATPIPTPASKPTPAPAASATPKPAPAQAAQGTLQDKISAWLSAQDINNFTINKDDSVDVVGSIHFSNLRYKKLPVRFNKIDGDVHIAGGLLETLQGLPADISGQLTVTNLDLPTWDGFPTSLGSLDLHTVTVPGPFPKFRSISGPVTLHSVSGLSNLIGLPEVIGGLAIVECEDLTALDGLPKQINGTVHIQNYNASKLKTLEAFNASTVDGKIMISVAGKGSPIQLPSKFNTTQSVDISGVFSGSIAFPSEVDGDLALESRFDNTTAYNNVEVTSWPTKINGDLMISADLLGKIQKINRVIREVNGKIVIQHASLPHPTSPYGQMGTVTLGPVLGLTQIKGVTKIDLGGSNHVRAVAFIEDTLNRVIAGDLEMLEAQEILIDAGYSKQARL